MAFRVEITERAARDLEYIYDSIHADFSGVAEEWFNGLEIAIYSLEEHPERSAITLEHKNLRHLLYGSKPHIYRIIYAVAKKARIMNILPHPLRVRATARLMGRRAAARPAKSV